MGVRKNGTDPITIPHDGALYDTKKCVPVEADYDR